MPHHHELNQLVGTLFDERDEWARAREAVALAIVTIERYTCAIAREMESVRTQLAGIRSDGSAL